MELIDVLTVAEAAQIYGLDTSTLRRACTGQKGYRPIFTSEECRQSGKTWLITRDAMNRVYGNKTE